MYFARVFQCEHNNIRFRFIILDAERSRRVRCQTTHTCAVSKNGVKWNAFERWLSGKIRV